MFLDFIEKLMARHNRGPARLAQVATADAVITW
jgi:hypothetical protein